LHEADVVFVHRSETVPQGLKPRIVPRTDVGAKAPTPYCGRMNRIIR
jgi:hypothetical protein